MKRTGLILALALAAISLISAHTSLAARHRASHNCVIESTWHRSNWPG
jgi:hypothetical protein